MALKLGREVVGRLEVEAIGYLLDAVICRGEQFLGSLQFQGLLIERRGEACMFLEQFSEGRIADAQFLRDFLDGEVSLQGLPDFKACPIDDIDVLGIFVQNHVALQGVHQTDEVVDDARQGLLRISRLFLCDAHGLLVQGDDFIAEPDVVDWFLGRQKSSVDPVVDVLALESYPVTLPSLVCDGVVSVPFAWEQKKNVTRFDWGFSDVVGLEYPFALGLVEQLVFIQYPTFVYIEVVAIGMPLSRIGISRGYFFSSYGADGESPLCISVCC